MICSSWHFEDIHLFVNRYHPILPHQPPSVLSLREGERGSTRSPVNFRQVLLIIIVIWCHDLIEAGDDGNQLVLTLTLTLQLCREGRRSSDGLVAQGIVAFQQRLYDKEKAEEVVDLHQVVHKMIRIAAMMMMPIILTIMMMP